MWLRLLTFYFNILKYFLRQAPCFINGLRCCASHASIVQSRRWLPKVDQAPGYAKKKRRTIHQEMQLLIGSLSNNDGDGYKNVT